MKFLPAIDLKDGQCVRLVQGDMGRSTVFNDDPAAQARAFAAGSSKASGTTPQLRRFAWTDTTAAPSTSPGPCATRCGGRPSSPRWP